MKKIILASLIILGILIVTPVKAKADSISYIYVDVKGEVNNPGVYRLETNSRAFQAVELAGGLTIDSYTRYVNLAKILTDEEVIYIPSVEEEIEESTLININTATLDELMVLDGIGEATANNIINYRNENGYFSSIEDIMNVPNIKQATYEKIKQYITI